MQNGVLTMGELETLPSESRLIGSADYFQQVLQPHDAAAVPMTKFVAQGSLEDGRSFQVRGLFIEGRTIRRRSASAPPDDESGPQTVRLGGQEFLATCQRTIPAGGKQISR